MDRGAAHDALVVGVSAEAVGEEVSAEDVSSPALDVVVSSDAAVSLVVAVPEVCATDDGEPEESLARPGSVPALTRAPISAATTAKTATLLPVMLRHEGRRAGLGLGGVLMAGDDGGRSSPPAGRILGGRWGPQSA
jgi:hypothetical protein